MTNLDELSKEFSDTDYRNKDVLRYLYWGLDLSSTQMGTVLNCDDKTILRWMDKNGIERRTKQTTGATYYTNQKGRCMWAVNAESGTENVSVARLTAVAEYGFDAVIDKHVHHKIPISWLNYTDNLEIKDPSEHLRQHSLGENGNNTKLTEKQVKEIKSRLNNTHESHPEIAEDYPVSRRTISNINCGDVWGHVDLE